MCCPASTCHSSAVHTKRPKEFVLFSPKSMNRDSSDREHGNTSCTSQICRAGPKRSRQPPDLGQHPPECESESFCAGSRRDDEMAEKKKGGRGVCRSWHWPAVCGSTDARRRSEERHPQSIATSRFLFVLEMSSGRGALPLGHFDHGLRGWPSWELGRCPPPSKRWLGGPCRESGDEEKIWGRWRTCRETAARKPWRGGSILNRLSTDLIDGSILGGEWTDRCRCRSAGWVVQVLAAAACSSTSQEKGPREHGCPVEPIPTSPPSTMGPTTRSERARFVCLSTPPHTAQWHPIVKR